MTEASTAERRASLEEEQATLRRRLGELGAGGEAGLEFDHNFADTSQVTAERGQVEALVGSLRDLLRDVEDALAKLDAGTYGRCEVCGEEIVAARLDAKPAARRCITCASKR